MVRLTQRLYCKRKCFYVGTSYVTIIMNKHCVYVHVHLYWTFVEEAVLTIILSDHRSRRLKIHPLVSSSIENLKYFKRSFLDFSLPFPSSGIFSLVFQSPTVIQSVIRPEDTEESYFDLEHCGMPCPYLTTPSNTLDSSEFHTSIQQ